MSCLLGTPLLLSNIFRTIQWTFQKAPHELSKICWSLLEVSRLPADSQQTSDRITWRHQVLIWSAVQISSPNSESFPNQPTKFGYHQTPDRFLTDSWQTPDLLVIDSWPTPDWLLTDSQQTSDRLTLNPTDIWQTHIEPNGRNLLEMTPGLNLESHPNQLSKFGELSKSALQIWLPSCLTPDWLPTDSHWTKQQKFDGDDTRSQFWELLKSALQIWLPSTSWQATDWVLTCSCLTPNRLQTD